MTGRGTFSVSRAPSTDTQIDARAAAIEAIPLRSASSTTRRGEAASTPHYEVVERIHRGGMGEILLAYVKTPTGFRRRVVLKGLLSRLSADNVSHDLFMREAHLMARLDHPNIVQVFDLPELDGRPYLVMEYVRGRNLHQVIDRSASRGPSIPPLIALTIVSEALRGLHSAHRLQDERGVHLGLVHRDVSPGNILVSFFGEVKVTDFGIAKVADSPKYTGPRSIRGKARYVAPEQVHGHGATTASDIYSAGVVLAESLMGAPLWERGSVAETLMAIVTEDRTEMLNRILRGLPPVAGLRSALRGALALEPQARPKSALLFAEILEAVAREHGPRPTSVELGLYLRDLFRGDDDVPQGDGFGVSGQPATLMKDPLDDEDTELSTRIGAWSLPPPPPPPSVPLRMPIDEASPATPVIAPSSFDAVSVPLESAVFADPAEPAREHGTSATVGQKANREDRQRQPTAASSNMALFVTGVFIGASLAIVGCVLALILG